MIADFPFKIDFEKVPIERLIEILQGNEKPDEISREKQDSISFLIVLLFQTFFSESNSYPLIITSPDVIKIIIEFAQNTNAKYCVGCTEFFLSILSKISAEDIINYLEDFPEISELIVNCLEYDNPDAQKLIQYVYTFLKHITDMGATDHETIADLIAQMQDPISELCDSEEGKTRAYAATVLKYYYPDVFDSKYI
ncbi:hypothetical protein TVAG_180410 [Trichomonas vaginalis G3]|uniref:Uncharacterized protein n=1 Tax=Trichomonas vaginalis (strain ATCC PRA-98 / G3) TaxID=412133 RepID=A2EE70_TRIV3|nr:armadillo (ARM) repeat-containing protein family [Trichomonas vaginalis G3]EAY09067.1 hypothetical protein TVAG_180410 [Trichomonas vaginalis G3]KAI5503417.1 armadillo (ARM) repeat-containing protein family [Trichomonas vaginalis G3]|eukprot:XP_001321290.1 hypothetical protein [Trichomonas vaginalis G3]